MRGMWEDTLSESFVDIGTKHVNEDGYTAYNVLHFSGYRWEISEGIAGLERPDNVDEVVDRYVESIIPTAQPGEVWEATVGDGEKVRVMPYVSYDGKAVEFFSPEVIYLQSDIPIRRLIITAEGEYVG